MQAKVEDQRRSDDRREGADGVSVTNRCFDSVPQIKQLGRPSKKEERSDICNTQRCASGRWKKNIPSKFAPPPVPTPTLNVRLGSN